MISYEQQLALKKIGERHSLDLIILHGSFAKNNVVTQETDVDIAIYRRGGIRADEVVMLNQEIQAAFSGKEVDIQSLHAVTPLFRFEVMRHGILLAGDRRFYQDFYLYSYRDYHDSKPLYQALARIQEQRQELLTQTL